MSPNTCLHRCRLAGLLITGLLVVACFSLVAEAKDLTGTHEISFSGMAGSQHEKDIYNNPYYSDNNETYNYSLVTLNLRYGYYFYKGFEIEPELMWTGMKHEKSGLSVHGNLVYNFDFAKDSACCRIIPFVLAGYSIGTAAPWWHLVAMPGNQDKTEWKTQGFGIGAGVKAFVSPRVALRLEYRYESYTRKYTSYYYSKTTSDYNNVLAGFSIFFPPCKKGSCSTGCAK